MNRADKIAFGFVAIVCASLTTAAGITIAEQQRKIAKLKQENTAFRKVMFTPAGIDLIKSALNESRINKIVSETDIPDDIRKFL